MSEDLALLRAYEPVVKFTAHEHFLPMPVDPYVARCSLWVADSTELDRQLVEAGDLDVHALCEHARANPDHRLSLRYVQKPLDPATLRRHGIRVREHPPGRGRLGSVGLLARFVDSGLRASLLVRGRVPGSTGATAQLAYREDVPHGSPVTYYGRVVRDGGWVCLQYWYFYAMNDWRSAFAGINEHESDWEMVTVYLAPAGRDNLAGDSAGYEPRWAAFSSHDYEGDDLRRRWDDPELHREGDHPVVYAGAGSHSGAFLPGDYLVQVQPRGRLGTFSRAFERLSTTLFPWLSNDIPGVGIPFIDYARGDGTAAGPGHAREWSPVLIDDTTPWVRDYRGLWGLDTRDRLGGERAPGGPRYERDGAVRASWADPVGWAGLHKVAPTPEARSDLLRSRIADIDTELADLDKRIEESRAVLRERRVVALALDLSGSDAVAQARQREVHLGELEVSALSQRRADLNHEHEMLTATLERGWPAEPPQAHVQHAHRPYESTAQVRERFLTVWSALSAPLMLAALVGLLFVPQPFLIAAMVALAVFLGIEAFARRKFLSFVVAVLALTAVAGLGWLFLVVLAEHLRITIAVVIGVVAGALLLSSTRELVSRARRQ